MEWAQYGIRVNSVSPGLVKTAMTYWVPQQPDWEQQLKYYGGFPRLAEVQELGGAYVYLLSDAASYTTSIDIPVNGVIGSEFPFSLVAIFCLTALCSNADYFQQSAKRSVYEKSIRIKEERKNRRIQKRDVFIVILNVKTFTSEITIEVSD
jgi:hypothetical protein